MAPRSEDDVETLKQWLMKYGLTGALLAWIVYVGVTAMVADIHQTRVLMEEHVTSSHLSQLRIEAILRQSCVIQAVDKQQQMACWSAGYK